eukprot:766772-Hanusia_phi.AAC.4
MFDEEETRGTDKGEKREVGRCFKVKRERERVIEDKKGQRGRERRRRGEGEGGSPFALEMAPPQSREEECRVPRKSEGRRRGEKRRSEEWEAELLGEVSQRMHDPCRKGYEQWVTLH